MVQKLSVSISIPIPEDKVLIKKVVLEEYKKLELVGVFWNMSDLEIRTKKRGQWLKENILFNSTFRKELDSEVGGFVFYPKFKGQSWSFQATKMANFLDSNFHKIFS